MKLGNTKLAATASALLFIAGSAPANAATANANLNVTAKVSPSCQVTTTPVAFGQVDVTRSLAYVNTGGQVIVTCTAGTPWAAYGDHGQHSQPSGLGFIRAMAGISDSSKLVQYELQPSRRAGDWTLTNGYTGVGTGNAQVNWIWAVLLGGQTSVPAGDYTDTVVVDLEY